MYALALLLHLTAANGRCPAKTTAVMTHTISLFTQTGVDEVGDLAEFTAANLVQDFLGDEAARKALAPDKPGVLAIATALIKLRNLATKVAEAPKLPEAGLDITAMSPAEYKEHKTALTTYLATAQDFMNSTLSGEEVATTLSIVESMMYQTPSTGQPANGAGQPANAPGQPANANPGQPAGNDQTVTPPLVQDVDQLKSIMTTLKLTEAQTTAKIAPDNSDIQPRLAKVKDTPFTGDIADFAAFTSTVMTKLAGFGVVDLMVAITKSQGTKIDDIPVRNCITGGSSFDSSSKAMFSHLIVSIAGTDLDHYAGAYHEQQNGVLLFKALFDEKGSAAAKVRALKHAKAKRTDITLNVGDDVGKFISDFLSVNRVINDLSRNKEEEDEIRAILADAIMNEAYSLIAGDLRRDAITVGTALEQLRAVESSNMLSELSGKSAKQVSANKLTSSHGPSSSFSPSSSSFPRKIGKRDKWPENTKNAYMKFCKEVGPLPGSDSVKKAWRAALHENGNVTSANSKLMAAAKTPSGLPASANAVDIVSDTDSEDFYEMQSMSRLYESASASRSFADVVSNTVVPATDRK